MIKNIAYVFVFLIFLLLAGMWMTIDRDSADQNIKIPPLSEQEVTEKVFQEELSI